MKLQFQMSVLKWFSACEIHVNYVVYINQMKNPFTEVRARDASHRQNIKSSITISCHLQENSFLEAARHEPQLIWNVCILDAVVYQ